MTMATKKTPGSVEARLNAMEFRQEHLEKTVAIVALRFADLVSDAAERARELATTAGGITEVVSERLPMKSWDEAFADWEKVRDEARAAAAGA
jgi:hypothetical protein